MDSVLNDKAKKIIVPLLFKFKRLINQPTTRHSYNETIGVNVSDYDGSITPEVLKPRTLSNVKTVNESEGGED